MASSRTADAAALALSTEATTRLLRAFCFLRQHERKAKAARKLAELQTWSRAQTGGEYDQPFVGQGGEPSVDPSLGSRSPVKTDESDSKRLHRELRELQKGILAGTDTTGCITAGDLGSALRGLNCPTPKAEVQWMIWEVDDDLDGCVTWDEFRSGFARALADKHALEPCQLFLLALFLLCDADNSLSVSALELTTELKRLTKSDRLAETLMAALRTDAEGQLMRRFSLADFLEVMLADLPASFALH